MADIPFGDYLPDQATFNNPGSTVAKNCLPRTAGSYGPLGALANVASALDSRCQGGYGSKDDDGDVLTFAGDAAKLYTVAGGAPADVSKAGNYTVDTEEAWEFAQFGQDIVALNIGTDPQVYTLDSSSLFADLGGSPPKARHINQWRGFCVLGNLDESGTKYPNRIRWSAINDHTDYPTIGSSDAAAKQSDQNDFDVGSWVQAIVGPVGGIDGAVFCETAIYRAVYTGDSTVFALPQVENARGTPCPNGVINVGDFALYIGEDGFYIFNGQDSIPIGDQKIDKTFFASVNQILFARVWGAADVINKVAMWVYPSTAATDGEPDKFIAYNWTTGRWTDGDFDSQIIFRDYSAGVDLDSIDSELGYNIDTLPFSLDSRALMGGRLLLSGFDSSKRLARFTGANLAATFETGDFGGKNRVQIDGIRPYIDATDASVTIAIKYRDDLGDTPTATSANAIDGDGQAHFDIEARYARAQVNVTAGATWTHAQGIDADFMEVAGV